MVHGTTWLVQRQDFDEEHEALERLIDERLHDFTDRLTVPRADEFLRAPSRRDRLRASARPSARIAVSDLNLGPSGKIFGFLGPTAPARPPRSR